MKKLTARIPGGLIVAAGVLLGLLLILVLNSPRVIEFSPRSGGADVSSMTQVRISFSRPMQKLSVQARLNFEPSIPGIFTWEEETLIFEPETPWPSGTQVEVTLQGGAQGSNRVPMLGRRNWSFNIGQPRLIYVWPSEGKSDLYQFSLDSEAEPEPLTQSEYGILEYSLSQDGSLLVYSAYAEDGGTELRLLDMIAKQDQQLLLCEATSPCDTPSLNPTAEKVAFERVIYASSEAGRLLPSLTSVWVMPLGSPEAALQISPADHNARTPGWAPTGWLVYYDETLRAMALIDPENGGVPSPFNYVPTSLGVAGSWSPDGTRLVYPEIVFPEEVPTEEGAAVGVEAPLYYSHLYRVDVSSGRTADISPGPDWMVEDSSPSFSPDGDWLAFTRKYLDPDRWSPGRQVWLMNAERTEVLALTYEPGANYSSLAWSPDSQRLVFMRKSVADLSLPPEVWWLDIASGDAYLVVSGGFLPSWIP
jgi:WD40 repeat protein